MKSGGWVVAYTDGSAKLVRGWMQVGWGVAKMSAMGQKLFPNTTVCPHVGDGTWLSAVTNALFVGAAGPVLGSPPPPQASSPPTNGFER